MECFSYFSFVIFKMLFFIFWPLPDKLLDCPKKLFCPTLGEGELQPSAHNAYDIHYTWTPEFMPCR